MEFGVEGEAQSYGGWGLGRSFGGWSLELRGEPESLEGGGV